MNIEEIATNIQIHDYLKKYEESVQELKEGLKYCDKILFKNKNIQYDVPSLTEVILKYQNDKNKNQNLLFKEIDYPFHLKYFGSFEMNQNNIKGDSTYLVFFNFEKNKFIFLSGIDGSIMIEEVEKRYGN